MEAFLIAGGEGGHPDEVPQETRRHPYNVAFIRTDGGRSEA